MTKIREWESSTSIDKLYRILRHRKFLASCWKNVIDFKEKTEDAPAADLTSDVKDKPQLVEAYLRKELELEDHEVFASLAQIYPSFIPDSTKDIWIDDNGKSIGLAKLRIYHPDIEFIRPIPHIFVPLEKISDAIEVLKEYNKYCLAKIKA